MPLSLSVARSAHGLAVLGIIVLTGCSRPPEKDRYRPQAETARSALETALSEWKKGVPPGTITSRSPEIKVVDSAQRPGLPLQDFEILGEVAGEGFRCFAVRLEHAAPKPSERTRYVVIGIDPLWVFRQEDYDMLAHWDHAMSPAPAATGTETAGDAPVAPENKAILPEVAPDE